MATAWSGCVLKQVCMTMRTRGHRTRLPWQSIVTIGTPSFAKLPFRIIERTRVDGKQLVSRHIRPGCTGNFASFLGAGSTF